MTPAGAPIATPPAKVAFKISSIQNFYRRRALNINVARQLPVSDMIVLLTINDRWKPFYGNIPALNEGQNIHKKSVPIIAKVVFI